MPLHDWTDERGWDSVYPVWLTYLLEPAEDSDINCWTINGWQTPPWN